MHEYLAMLLLFLQRISFPLYLWWENFILWLIFILPSSKVTKSIKFSSEHSIEGINSWNSTCAIHTCMTEMRKNVAGGRRGYTSIFPFLNNYVINSISKNSYSVLSYLHVYCMPQYQFNRHPPLKTEPMSYFRIKKNNFNLQVTWIHFNLSSIFARK